MGLKGIHPVISPQLLKVLAEMGHGDEIVFADMHFPAASIAKSANAQLVTLDGLRIQLSTFHIFYNCCLDSGHPIPLILTQVLKLFPLDQYVDQPVSSPLRFQF
jgi:L-fucose mutarotase